MAILKETVFNKRAGKHTFVVRYYKGRTSKTGKYYMRIGAVLYVYCSDSIWRKVKAYDIGLVQWVKEVFGINLPNSSKFGNCKLAMRYTTNKMYNK